jgi:ferredoxin
VLSGVSQRSYVTRVHGALDGQYATTLARAERTDTVLAAAGESGLYRVVTHACHEAGRCGTHLPRGTAPPPGVDALTGTLRQQRSAAQAELDHRLTGAEPGYPVRPVSAALLALLAAGLAAYGLRPRIAEYEFGA